MAPEKTEGPNQVLTFAGKDLDFLNLEVRLPTAKVDKILRAIRNLLLRKRVQLKELQSLTGLLNFACSVITPGRVFIRLLINLTIGVRRARHSIRLTRETKKDLRIWETFLAFFNGNSFFLEEVWSTSYNLKFTQMLHNLAGTASALASTGLMVHGPMHEKQIICAFWSFFLLLSTWCSELRNKRVLFMTDNESVVHAINKRTAKDTEMVELLHAMALICLRNNIFFRARHIPTVSLSR